MVFSNIDKLYVHWFQQLFRVSGRVPTSTGTQTVLSSISSCVTQVETKVVCSDNRSAILLEIVFIKFKLKLNLEI